MNKNQYIKPISKVKVFTPNSLMIPISGETTPEDADAKGGWVEDEEGSEYKTFNVWK